MILKPGRIVRVNEIEILIISDKFDFSTDLVCLELSKGNGKYLRINRDEFSKYEVLFDIDKEFLKILFNGEEYLISEESLRSIYYRAPIYLRDIYKPNISEEDQLFRTQWTAFIRNLIYFDQVKWVNSPTATFEAENKLIQLRNAIRLGFLCPPTKVVNTAKTHIDQEKAYIVKTLDSGVLRIEDKEAFIYSNKIRGSELTRSYLSSAPLILQDYVSPKIDIRVTVIGRKIFSVRILKNGSGIEGDWRMEKNDVQYESFDLPDSVEKKCFELMESLNLNFGAIDLIESDGSFYFLEINPTGEWGWLVDTAKLNIHKEICNFLSGEKE